MKRKAIVADNLTQSGQNLTRILIASYFIAVSLRLIDGTDASVLTVWFMSETISAFVGSLVMFVLGYFVLMGVWLRPAALLLGIILFWASYISNVSDSNPNGISAFWRDLALVGALILTYTQTGRHGSRGRAMFQSTADVSKVSRFDMVTPRRVTPVHPPVRATPEIHVAGPIIQPVTAFRKPKPAPEAVVSIRTNIHASEVDNVFAEDRALATRT